MATQALTSNLTTYDARGNAVRVAETSALFVLLSVLATIGEPSAIVTRARGPVASV